jgi:hypothetical protein
MEERISGEQFCRSGGISERRNREKMLQRGRGFIEGRDLEEGVGYRGSMGIGGLGESRAREGLQPEVEGGADKWGPLVSEQRTYRFGGG